jgi:hypothetical protein
MNAWFPTQCILEEQNGTLGDSVLYAGRLADVKGTGFVNSSSDPCGGGVEYLHRDPASRRRRLKGKSQN